MPITKIIDNGSLLEIHDQDFRGLLITELEKSTGIILKKDTQYLYITYPTTLTTQTIDPSQVVDPVNTGVDDLFNIIDGYLQTGAAGDLNGFIDYNDTTGAFSVTADTWTDLPNNGQGAFSNDSYKPTGVTELIDTTTGYIDPTELNFKFQGFHRLGFEGSSSEDSPLAASRPSSRAHRPHNCACQ